MDVVAEIDAVAVTDCIKRSLTECGRKT